MTTDIVELPEGYAWTEPLKVPDVYGNTTRGTFTLDGLEVTARASIVPDDDGDLSWLGSVQWDRPDGRHPYRQTNARAGVCWVVADSRNYEPEDVDKYGPEAVAGWVAADLDRLEAWVHEEWSFVAVVVSLRHATLGELACDGLYGIESDSGDYFTEVAAGCLREAILGAIDHLAAMRDVLAGA